MWQMLSSNIQCYICLWLTMHKHIYNTYETFWIEVLETGLPSFIVIFKDIFVKPCANASLVFSLSVLYLTFTLCCHFVSHFLLALRYLCVTWPLDLWHLTCWGGASDAFAAPAAEAPAAAEGGASAPTPTPAADAASASGGWWEEMSGV